jgi:hypothetical protein
MSNGYLPSTEAELVAWMANFAQQYMDHAAALGYPPETVPQVQTTCDQFSASSSNHDQAVEAARSAKQAKDTDRAAALALVRPLVRNLQSNPAMTDALRALFRITVPDSTQTSSTLAVEQNKPLATVDIAQSLQHTINFVDEGTPRRRAKPDGAMGAEIWMAVGQQPADPSAMTLKTLATRSGYTVQFDGADAGKQAWYRMRWVSTRGVRGPWSALASGTIAA